MRNSTIIPTTMTINGIFPEQIAGIMLIFIVLCTISWRSYALIVPSSVGRGITGLRGPNTQLGVASTSQQGMSERIRRIKDVSFEKEVIRDVTAAEFAMVVVGSSRIVWGDTRLTRCTGTPLLPKCKIPSKAHGELFTNMHIYNGLIKTG